MRNLIRIFLSTLAVFVAMSVQAGNASRYAQTSRLASGKWAKVKVSETGMQFLSNTQLRNLGFTDPGKVNVYGYGGRAISALLDESHPDDLPQQPVVRTDAGIIFYGVNTVKWTDAEANHSMKYSHTQNLFSNDSFYFLSDAEGAVEIPEIDCTISAEPTINQFTERILHEKDMFIPSTFTGLTLGEDFRTNTLQQFPFRLPGSMGDVKVCVNFATRTTNGSSSIMLTANGSQLPATTANTISAVSNSEMFMRSSKVVASVPDAGDKLNLDIKYTQGGVLYMARLDYIEVNYTRRLELDGGVLAFYEKVANPKSVFGVKGCTAETQIWDVTDPARPVKILYTLTDGTATFVAGEKGYREFIAFNPSQVKTTAVAAGAVTNQNLHAREIPDMLIITPALYKAQAERVANLHRQDDGFDVLVVTPEEIYNEFSSGTPDVSAFRKAMKMWVDRGTDDSRRLRYCLLFGRPNNDPRCLMSTPAPAVPIYFNVTGLTGTMAYSTDDFIGFLEDPTKGTVDLGAEKLSVGIGRLPVTTAAEAAQAVDKIISYARSKDLGPWRNNVLIVADDQDNGIHMEQAEDVYRKMKSDTGNGTNFLYERLYLDNYEIKATGKGNSYPDATDRLKKVLNDGVSFLDYIGHANPREWGHEHLLTFSDINALNNRRWPVILAATCEFARWDDETVSGAEIMWLNQTGGAIAFIAASRTVYITPNGTLNSAIGKNLYGRNSDGSAYRLGDVYRLGKNDVGGSEDNKLRYILMGDPALRVLNPDYLVEIESLGGLSMAEAEENPPIVAARGRIHVSGRILNPDGSPATDFNGTISPTLFDAERPVQTRGNGSEGKSILYNDRKNKLLTTSTRVADGKWDITLILPSEIDNNFSPALLNFYACSDDGREANGSTESLYVYGWSDEGDNDLEGPSITGFTLNSERFTSGDIVSPAPIVYATLSDESGINVSNFGIGHQLTLTLDGKKVYDDVASYFAADPDQAGSGTIAYPLNDIEPGEHKLSLIAWDNANNSSTAELEFRVAVNAVPTLYDVIPTANPASEPVTFSVAHDWPQEGTECTIDIFSMSGKKIWSGKSGYDGQITWDLCDGAGARVDRGIYLYRATVKSAAGTLTTKTKRIAVTAP